MEQVEVDGLRVAYERAGTGPPLVLLHGGVGDGPTLWRRQLEGLCDDFTVVAWDAPGAGGSSDSTRVVRHGRLTPTAWPALSSGSAWNDHVAGLSFGGPLALELYRRHAPARGRCVLWPALVTWP